jgi:flagellar basal-body rod protein FlgG
MFDSLYIGATGMIAHQLQMDTIANNLANLNTIGFRRGLVTFSDVSAQVAASALAAVGRTAASTTSSLLSGAGSVVQTTLSLLPGTLQSTQEPLNVAINGSGFFEVLRPDGTPAYARAGALEVNSDGVLALSDGTPLSAQIQVPPDAGQLTISPDGRVSALLPGAGTPTVLGQIELVNFANPGALIVVGANQYTAPAAAGAPQTGKPGSAGLGQLQQGYLEASNVDLNQEMTALLLAQRGFELNSKVIQSTDQLWSLVNGLVRS